MCVYLCRVCMCVCACVCVHVSCVYVCVLYRAGTLTITLCYHFTIVGHHV